MECKLPHVRVFTGLQISQKLAQHNYQTEFLNVLMKYRWGEILFSPSMTPPRNVLSCPLYLHFPLHLFPTLIANGCMVA